MRVAALQFAPVFGQKRENIMGIRDLLGGVRVDLVVLPELCTTGYQFRDRDELLRLAEPADGPTVGDFWQMARETGVIIVFGFAELRGGEVYNTAAVVTPSGPAGFYRKIHLFGREKSLFAPGEQEPPVFAVGNLRLGVMICYDWAFPEVARIMALKGAHIVAHPSNLMLPFCQQAMVTRAVENRLFFITANRTGCEARIEPPCRFTGRSQIVAPDGTILAAAAADSTTLITAEIDLHEAEVKGLSEGVSPLDDRRPELYRLLCGNISSSESPGS